MPRADHQPDKNWVSELDPVGEPANPGTATPISGLSLEDLEERVFDGAADYAEELAAASQPLDSDLTAIAALSTTAYGRAFLALADAAAGRTALGLGTAATSASADFQPIDSDLTAIAALTTTSYGRAFLALADAAAGRTALGLGTAATSASGDFDAAGTSAAAKAAILAVRRTLWDGRARPTTAGAAGTKYFVSTNSDSASPLAGTGAASSNVRIIRLDAAELAVSGLTPKLRVVGKTRTATTPGVSTTFGLYPITYGGSITLGTVVAGSTAVVAAAANGNPITNGSDFDVPTAGEFTVGYELSGTPAAIFVAEAELQLRYV